MSIVTLPLTVRGFIRTGTRLAASAAALLLLTATGLHAQRLPDNAQPQHYALTLTPDLAKATFAGDETIDVTLSQPANSIVLNAAELQFQSVTAKAGDQEAKASVTLDEAKQQATFAFPATLPAGPVSLKIAYTGILNDKLRGFYLSKGGGHAYAVTQFEPTDARRAFPSFDEPAYKATFDITVIAPKEDTVISNTNIIADGPGPSAGQHTIQFARTPRMSTYLVAFLVGDFQCVAGSSDGVPIRACATPERVQYAHFALESAQYILHYYNTYFGIKYPMPKLDMIGIPDFEAGAMENFGAITYRESDMLADEKTAPVEARQRVALVVAHEMAHQWFGDMVTMKWWNNLWLNEGFATWMENKPLESWKPEWHIDEQVASGLNGAMNLDSRQVTRTIRAEANTPDEINEMFDGITYQKGGAILHMVESYLGEETFRQGVHNYLQAHIYGNATAEDFWNAQTANSHKPVDKIMASFIGMPGVPLLSFSQTSDGHVDVSQSRFYLNPKAAHAAATSPTTSPNWTIPVCFAATTAGHQCELLTAGQSSLTIPADPLFFADSGAAGYYRSAYTPRESAALLAHVETSLTPAERILVVGNELALMRAGRSKAGDFLDLAGTLRNDESAGVMDGVETGVATLWTRVAQTDAERKELSAWVDRTFAPRLASLGEPKESDTPQQRVLRANLLEMVGGIGEDPAVISRSRTIAGEYLASPDKVDATLGQAALSVAAAHGDSTFFDQLQKTAETSSNPDISNTALYELARFQDPALVRRALEYASSGKVRNQDSIHLLSGALANVHTQDAAWRYIEQNWPRVKAQFTTASGGALVGSTGFFCSAEKRDEIRQFFTTHPVPATANALQRSQNAISDCVELRAEQEANLQQWLSAGRAAQASGR